MAAASYTTDLTTLSTAQATTGWSEPGTWLAGGTPTAETDYFINGTSCVSKTYNAAGLGGLVYTAGAGVTIPTDGAFLCWQYFAAPNALANLANGGIRLIVGSSTTAFKSWYLGGSDTYQYGGWQNLAVSPTLTADATVGSPTATLITFGWAANNSNAVSKGNPFASGALRYGRCESRINGGDLANGYATFAGFAAQNDNTTNRWGLIQAVDGGYLWQGLMTLGYTSAVDFRDSNTQIIVANTSKVTANFNRIEIRNASTRVDWTGISFLALGSVSKGRLEMIDNADVNIDACSFTNMDTFSFQSNGTVNDSVFRRCGIVTLGGAAFDGCTFDRATGTTAVIGTPAQSELVVNTSFVSDGTGYAMEITGTATTISMSGNNFAGYASVNGSTGNEAIFVNIATGTMTINIINGGTTPSIRTAGATVNIVAGAVNAKAKSVTETGVAISNARVHLEAMAGGPFPAGASVTISNSSTTATVTHTAHGLLTNDKVIIRGASLDANNGVFSITVTSANAYTYTMLSAPGSSPTGSINATFVVLNGLTDVNGEITMSRVFPSDQPVTGQIRKSSGSPFYKNAALTGIVDNATGGTFTGVMISDD